MLCRKIIAAKILAAKVLIAASLFSGCAAPIQSSTGGNLSPPNTSGNAEENRISASGKPAGTGSFFRSRFAPVIGPIWSKSAPLPGTDTPIFAAAVPSRTGESYGIAIGVSGSLVLSRNGAAEAQALIGTGCQAAALSPSAALLVVACAGKVSVRQLSTLEVVSSTTVFETRFSELRFAPSEDAVFLGGIDGSVYRWRFSQDQRRSELTSGEVARIYERYIGHAGAVSALAVKQEGTLFFSADRLGALSGWRPYDADRFGGALDRSKVSGRFFVDDEQRVRASRADGEAIEHLALSTDQRYLVAATELGALELWQLQGMNRVAVLPVHTGMIYDLIAGPGEGRWYTLGRDGKIVLSAIENGVIRVVSERLADPAPVKLARSEDGAVFGAGTDLICRKLQDLQ